MTEMTRTNWGTLVMLLVATTLLFAGAAVVAGDTAPQTADSHTPTEGQASFVVELTDTGDADIAVTYTYNLSDEDRQAAFEELQTNETATASFRDSFESRMASVVSNANNVTDREMSISDASIVLETVDSTGTATLSVTWNSLAATDGENLVVTEPFASGFEPDRPFYVMLPSDYDLVSSQPEPDSQSDGSLSWSAGSDLSDFEVVTAPAEADDGTDDGSDGTDDGTDDDGMDDGDDMDGDDGTDGTDGDDGDSDGTDGDSADDGGPGFGLLLPVAGLLGYLVARRRR